MRLGHAKKRMRAAAKSDVSAMNQEDGLHLFRGLWRVRDRLHFIHVQLSSGSHCTRGERCARVLAADDARGG